MKRARHLYAACVTGTPSLSACYVVPVVDPQGNVQNYHCRLPPAGVVTGTVTNRMTGKGRFQLQYGSEILTGEATRVSNGERDKLHVGS